MFASIYLKLKPQPVTVFIQKASLRQFSKFATAQTSTSWYHTLIFSVNLMTGNIVTVAVLAQGTHWPVADLQACSSIWLLVVMKKWMTQPNVVSLTCTQEKTNVLLGTWCKGITPAQHAGGAGFNPQCVHFISAPSPLGGKCPLQNTCSPCSCFEAEQNGQRPLDLLRTKYV